MKNIRSDPSRRKKDPLAGFLAPKDLLDAFLAETGTSPENAPEQVAGTRQNSFPADSSGTDSAPLRVLVGFSGGADSTALLDRLSGMPGYSVAAVRATRPQERKQEWAAAIRARAAIAVADYYAGVAGQAQ